MKNKNVVFTIAAKNYLSLAATLRKSVFKNNSEIDFKVFVVDELNHAAKNFNIENCEIINCSSFIDDGYEDMAFKYDITEFNTAVKPFCFDYLMTKGYSKAIYFDPDVFVYNSLETSIIEEIGDKLILLTPHYKTIENEYTGVVPEGLILWVGVVNMGFCCINLNHNKSEILLDWWKNRLSENCYADKFSGLHTDQKWIDFVPYYFPNECVISHNLGYNVSIWNLHEREIEYIEGDSNPIVLNRINRNERNELTFFHFSGFDPSSKDGIHKHHIAYDLFDFPDLRSLIEKYRKELISHGFFETSKWDYSYNSFSNGYPITKLHRRIYRRLTDLNRKFIQLFDSNREFYHLLQSNGLMSKKNDMAKAGSNQISVFNSKLKIIYLFMKIAKKIFGIERYSLLLRLLVELCRPENQIFLLKDFGDEGLYRDNFRVVKNKNSLN